MRYPIGDMVVPFPRELSHLRTSGDPWDHLRFNKPGFDTNPSLYIMTSLLAIKSREDPQGPNHRPAKTTQSYVGAAAN